MRNCGVPWRGRIIKSRSVSEIDTMIPNYEFRIPNQNKKVPDRPIWSVKDEYTYPWYHLDSWYNHHALYRILSYPWCLTHITTLQNTPQEIAQVTEQITHAQPPWDNVPELTPRNSHSRTHVWLHPRRSICWLVFHLTLITAGSLWKHHQLYLRFIGFHCAYFSTVKSVCQYGRKYFFILTSLLCMGKRTICRERRPRRSTVNQWCSPFMIMMLNHSWNNYINPYVLR